MRTVNLLVIAFLVAFANAAATNSTLGVNCQANTTMCSAQNSAFCCAVLTVSTWVKGNTTVVASTVCLNTTLFSGVKANSSSSATNTTAVCIVSSQNAFLVKLSAAVASVGFLSLFL